MSKSRGNTVDPWSVLNKEGCDPLRWYILNAAAPGKNLAFKRDDIARQQMPVFLTLWNVYSFFVSYANLSNPDLSLKLKLSDRPEIDRWLEAKRNKLIVDVTKALEDYDAAEATRLWLLDARAPLPERASAALRQRLSPDPQGGWRLMPWASESSGAPASSAMISAPRSALAMY